MASAGRRACLYRPAHPLPLGAGEYVRPAGVGSACGEGVGVSLRFSYLSARRRFISSYPSSSSLSACFAVSLCRPHPCPHASCASFPLLRPFLSPVFLCGFLSFLAPFLRRAGRGVLCLLALSVFGSRPLAPCPPALPLSSRASVLACPPLIVLDRSFAPSSSHAASCPLPPSRSCLIRPLCSSCPPRFSTSVGGERVGSFLLCLPFVPVVRAAG